MLLACPTGPEAVREYRFKHAQLGQKVYEGEIGREFVEWLEKEGMDWNGWWTNSYSREAQAIASVMSQHDIPVIVDVDDYFDGVASGNMAYGAWHGARPRMYRHMLKNADRRVASTPFLGEKYDCGVAPNFFVEERWDWPERERTDEKVVLLHAGSVNRAEDFLRQEKAFKAFLALPNTQIVFVGWMPSWAREYPVGKVVFCRWMEYEKYPRMR